MRLGKIGSSLLASAFDAILTSTLISEIGRQFLRNLLSLQCIFLLE